MRVCVFECALSGWIVVFPRTLPPTHTPTHGCTPLRQSADTFRMEEAPAPVDEKSSFAHKIAVESEWKGATAGGCVFCGLPMGCCRG